ncbi:MAG: adenosylhomocysteinase [Gammaproteobacteria bacterium]|nr:adenosylhomocysteinase [Gammaproteobacteria bacterium]
MPDPALNDYKLADIALADFGRREIAFAEAEMPALMALRRPMRRSNRILARASSAAFT